MHVLVVSQYFWPEEFRVNDLVAELVERGHRVTVLTGTPNYPLGVTFPDYARHPDRFASYAGAQIVRVPLVPRGSSALRLMLNYASFVLTACTLGIWKLRKIRFDVIFGPQLSPVTAMLPAVLLRRLRRRKFAMWVLDLWPDTLVALNVIKSSIVLKMVGRLTGLIYNRTDRLFVQSASFVPKIREWAKPTIEPEFLPNWSERFPDLANAALPRAIPAALPGTFTIMFAGAVGEAQDFPTILQAASELRDEPGLRWIVVGDGRESDWVIDEIARRDLTNVIMAGRHPVSAMPSFYRAADAMLVSLKAAPLFAMTIPGKVQSYFAAGMPVIAMLDGEGGRVVEEAGAGVRVAAGDTAGLVAAVRRLMAMPRDELAALGRAARDYSDQHFDRTTLIDRVEQALETLSASAKDGS